MINIAIPSYKRSKTITEKTLKYLKNCNVDFKNITVFVADHKEYQDYKYLEKQNIKIHIGRKGIGHQRNIIEDYYPLNSNVLCLDDDIEGLCKLKGKGTVPYNNILELAEKGFYECRKNNTKIWGVNAVNNWFFMKENISHNLRYIVACLYGFISNKDNSLKVVLEDKEDYERSIRYFDKYKKLIRFNNFAPKTAYYTEPGGLQETRTEERVTKSALYLANKYPQYCKMNNTKKSKHAEVRLNYRAK
jgi:hypothetical protein